MIPYKNHYLVMTLAIRWRTYMSIIISPMPSQLSLLCC